MISDIYETITYVASTPVQWMILVLETCVHLLSDHLVLALVSFLLGMVVLLALQALILMKIFRDQPVAPPPSCQKPIIKLPEVLRARIGHQSLKQKEDCVWLNFLTQFLFAELRDTSNVRRFLTKKIHREFEELLTSRTGVFVDELFLRDFSLGSKFPVFVGVSVDKCDLKDDIIETLDVRARMLYDGGFEIAIDAALPFGRTAYISVKILKLKGHIRFQFTSNPFSHWSLSFYEEPEIELDVSAQLDGRPMNKLKNIIASQIRRTLRKKHTLPTYKIRYKPFFQPKVEKPLARSQNLVIDGTQIGSGLLEVTIVGGGRLPVINKDAKIYCTISVDDLPWKQLISKERLKKPLLRKELVKNSSDQSLGLTVKDELVPDRLHPVVVVEQVAVGSPAHIADIKEGDIIISVSGNKVSSAKQAIKFLRSVKDKVSLQVETSTSGLEIRNTRSDERMVRRHSDMILDGDKSEASYLSDFLNVQTSLDDSASTISVPSLASSSKSRKWDVRKTKLIKSESSPSWNQKFIFTVQPHIAYLNICVWSHGGDRSARSDVIGSSSQDVLIGHASLNLDDIFLHCLVTLSGTLQDKIKLKHGQYQTEAELAKEWASHKGWDPELMYGELTLSFYFIPSLLNSNQRKSLASCRSDVIKKKNQMAEGVCSNVVEGVPKESNHVSQSSQSVSSDSQVFSQGHHQFDSTSFVTATFCDYCGKKIWMKEAFKCRTCNMVCHKKCLVKCLVNTFCTDGGVKKRSAQDEKWEPLAPSNRSRSLTWTTEPAVKNQATGVSDDSVTKYHSSTCIDDISVKGQGTPNEDGSEAEDSKETSVELSSQTEDVPSTSSRRGSDISNTLARFRHLKDRTDKIKDNVLRGIKKTKSPLMLSDRSVLEAKDIGAKLFLDMEPAQRKDKLDELITNLDEHLKLEMTNKETLEKEMAAITQVTDSGSPSLSKKRSEMKALEHKISKSTEKLDAMRLLMVQYCTALQVCFNDLEQDEDSQHSESSSLATTSQGSRVSYMGGFVKRASSSVKEKMSLIRKDFGRKGSSKPMHPQTSALKSSASPKQSGSRNNNRLLTSIIDGFSSKGGKVSTEIQSSENSRAGPQKGREVTTVSPPERDSVRISNLVDDEIHNVSDVRSAGGQRTNSLPRIEIGLDDMDGDINPNHFGESSQLVKDDSDNEPRSLVRMDSKISRSSSDSHLEINKMVSLNPDDILRYHGNSLPKILVSEDENSESDFLIIESSDENDLSDFYEDDRLSFVSDVAKEPSLNLMPAFIIGGKLPSKAGLNEMSDNGDNKDRDSGDDEENEVTTENDQECYSYVV